MADAKYGRLFTERDVLAILDEATMVVPEGFKDDDLDRILAMLIERAEADKAPMTFPVDEPLFLLRGQAVSDEWLALRGLARMLREEWPAPSISEIVETWTPVDMSVGEREAIVRLDRAGAFDG